MEANHLAMYVPRQQFCMICTCTPEPKVQLKKRKSEQITMSKDIDLVIKNFSTKKSLGPNGFPHEFYQIFNEKLASNLLKLFSKIQ